MIVRSLRLRNFRSFQESELRFDAEQNYIVGGNWQGKSSVVEAIAFALFGALPAQRVAGASVKIEHLLTEGATAGEVELTFSLDEHEYRIRRTLPRTSVKLTRDGVEIASAKKRVDEVLSDILAVDADFFLNVFYADQDRLRRSFDLDPKDRKVFVEELIGQEIWKKRIDGLRAAGRHLARFLADLSSGRFGAFVEEIDALSEEIEGDAERLEELEDEITEVRTSLPKTDRKTLRADEKRAEGRIAKLEHGETELQGENESLAAMIAGLKRGRCPTCTQNVAPTLRGSRVAELTRQIRANETKLRSLRKELDSLSNAYDDADFDDANERLDELTRLETEHADLEREHRRRVVREKSIRAKARLFGKKPDQHRRALEEIAFLKRLEEVIEQHRTSLRERIVSQLVIAMNDMLKRFYDDDFDAEAAVDGDLNLRVRLHGQEVPLANLSGAAKDIFAISLRYGLMRVAARRVDCLLLDEPTRHMDLKNVRRLKAVFDDLADRQLVIVTVQEEFADARGKHFVVSKDEKLRSVIATA
jgi:DNA repair exonuclease SbcCD ATPase subunit